MITISGLQKMTLLDYPGKIACIVFLPGCNFRCPFCHNWELVKNDSGFSMSEDEFFEWLETRKGLLDGVVISGGEPLLSDLRPFCRRIRDMGFLIKLDTNGYNNLYLQDLLDEKLVDYVAMDIKTAEYKYSDVVGIDVGCNVAIAVKMIMKSGVDYEFRTTVMNEFHDDITIQLIGGWIKGAKRYFLQPFVDSENVPEHRFTAPSKEDLERWKSIMENYVDEVGIRGQD